MKTTKIKKVLSLFLSMIMLLSVTAGIDLSAYASSLYIESSKNSDSAYSIEISKEYTSTLSGSGNHYFKFVVPETGYYKLSASITDCFCTSTSTYLETEIGYNHLFGKGNFNDVYGMFNKGYTFIINFYSHEKYDIKVDFKIEESQNYFTTIYNRETGLYYQINLANKDVKVLGPTSERYSYFIPSKITYKNDIYYVTSIDDYAFNSCYFLESVSIPYTVEHIGEGAFANCPKLANIIVENSNRFYKVVDDNLMTKDGTKLLWHNITDGKTSIVIDEGIETIGDGAFQEYTTLSNVTLPSTLKHIGKKAFYNCDIKNITLPTQLETIDESAFEGNKKIRTVTIPESTTTVGSKAFANCSKLTSVTVESATTTFGKDVFTGCPADMIMFVLDDSTAQTYAQSENIYTNKTAPDYLVKANCVHSYTVAFSTPATCTSNGCTVYTCPKCNETYVTIEQAKGHTIVTDEAVAPTCTQTGLTEGSHCSVCNEVLVAQKVIKANGHTPVIDEEIPATYYATGKTQGSHCSVCGAIITAQKTVAKLTLATPAITLTAQSKGFKATYKAITGATGYEIQYSTSSKFTSAKSVKTTALSKTVTKLTAKKKYYVRVRAYHTESGKGTVYSGWSSTKNVTTKK